MFTDRIERCTVDLAAHPKQRWNEVIACSERDMIRLADEATREVKDVLCDDTFVIPTVITLGAREVISSLYRREVEVWGDALGITLPESFLLNCIYELSHVNPQALEVFGCTAGVAEVPGVGMVLARNLDWPLRSVGRATRLLDFKEGDREFMAVGIAGYSGVLSGMVPGEYAVTLNWAPPNGMPRPLMGPTFLLRKVLETCDTFQQAVSALEDTAISTPAFFTVCGTKRGQGCVIERTQTKFVTRPIHRRAVVQGNHHVAPRFLDNNDCEAWLLEDSDERVFNFEQALKSATSYSEAAGALDAKLVKNCDTAQQMIFHPKSGEFSVWCRR